MGEELEPCPFCGNQLFIRTGVNAYGRCETEGCWVRERKLTVQLADSGQVAAWNTRPTCNATLQVDAGGLREKVARIIDPAAWDQRERHHAKGSNCEYVDEGDIWDQRADDVVAASLRMSDAILKLRPSPIEVRREVIEECARVADERKDVADQIAKRRHKAGENIDAALGVSITAENIAAAIRALSPESPDLATQAATLESELERVREGMVVQHEVAWAARPETQAEAEARGLA